MSLKPYATVAMQRYKVWKHVFDQRERWWEIYGSLSEWSADWNRLRAAGCDRDEAGGERAKVDPVAAPILAAHHEPWFAEARRTYGYAIDRRQVFPTTQPLRFCYVGEAGVTVYAEPKVSAFVTCFRPAVIGAGISDHPSVAVGFQRARSRAERAAVRRAARGASMGAETA